MKKKCIMLMLLFGTLTSCAKEYVTVCHLCEEGPYLIEKEDQEEFLRKYPDIPLVTWTEEDRKWLEEFYYGKNEESQ